MKVGMLQSRSGVAGLWAPSMDAAAALGAAEINAIGGILGEEIDLVSADCGFTVNEAVDAVDTLIAVEEVDVIIGGHPSNLRDAVSRRISGKLPYIYTSQYEGTACGPSTVAIGSTDRELLVPALRWLRDAKSAERFFFVGNDYVWPRAAFSTTRRLLREQGGRLVGTSCLPYQVTDHSEVLKQIVKSDAQVLIHALVGQCAVEFNRAFAAAGLDDRVLRFGFSIDETILCGIGAKASNNLFTASHYFAGQRSRTNDRFLERYHDAYGDMAPTVSSASVAFYEGLHVFAGLATDLGSRKGEDLARHLDRPLSRPAARRKLDNKPVGPSPSVFIGKAEGITLDVIAAFAA